VSDPFWGDAGGGIGWFLQKDKSLRQRHRLGMPGPLEESPSATMAYFVFVPQGDAMIFDENDLHRSSCCWNQLPLI
jgi:hypothetical protein